MDGDHAQAVVRLGDEWWPLEGLAPAQILQLLSIARRPEQWILTALASPPEGWFTFGHHVDSPGIDLEFWGEDESGLPIWERPRGAALSGHSRHCERLAFHDPQVTPCTWRDRECVAAWPGCASGEYNPACCRFPKSCSVDDVEVPRD